MIRLPLVLVASVGLAVISSDAHADDVIAVLQPAAEAGVPEKALANAKLSMQQTIDTLPMVSMPDHDVALAMKRNAAECAVDPECLVAAGKELGATRVVGVLMARDGGSFFFTLVMVDVEKGTVVLEAMEKVARKKLRRGVGPALQSFIRRAPSESQRANTLMQAGNQQFTIGEYSAALAKYTEAQSLAPQARLLFHIGQCHRKLGNHQQAIDLYERYLSEASDATDRAEVEGYISESRKVLENKQARIDANQKTKDEAARAAAERQRLLLERERNIDANFDQHPIRLWSYIGGGLGIGAAGAGVLFGLKASDDQTAYDNLNCGDAGTPLSAATVAECNDINNSGDKNALLANVFIGAGAALIVASAALFIMDPGNVERPANSGARVDIGPSSVMLTVPF